ncbi:complex I subunit 5 family protein [Rhodococcoides corynebacterioides]|uniref:complex I subunit 5 family protein n=1 Tax=Rhodococcoides corynebacterioides TaxID=53972 RepID=UPI000829854C|nr:proton-conducting transporter membrane subunit [Rhodococcus corynebacterioides]
MTSLLPAFVVVPALVATLVAMIPRIGAVAAGATALAGVVAAVALTLRVSADGPVDVALGGWAEPVGIALRADGLSAAFVLFTAVVVLVVTVFASGSSAARGTPFFWALSLALWSGLNAVYVAADLFNTYVALELVTVAAVGCVALGGRSAAAPALRYLLVAVAGSLWFLLAVGLLYARTGTLSLRLALDVLRDPTDDGALVATVLILATVGLALKSALVPLHAWLPPAHAGAPAAVSPLMSAVVIKASIFVLYRLWTSLPADAATTSLAVLVGAVGSVAVLWGSLAALRQARLKRVVAYSTVAQVGYFVLLLPLVVPALRPEADDAARAVAELAVQGTVAMVAAHALAKSAMFMAAGCLLHARGTDEIAALRGAVVTNPGAVLAFGVAGVALAGLPPALAFSGKWQLLTAVLESGQWWWLIALLGGGLLTAAYTVRVLAVLVAERETGTENTPVPVRMTAATLVTAVAAGIAGIASAGWLATTTVGVF